MKNYPDHELVSSRSSDGGDMYEAVEARIKELKRENDAIDKGPKICEHEYKKLVTFGAPLDKAKKDATLTVGDKVRNKIHDVCDFVSGNKLTFEELQSKLSAELSRKNRLESEMQKGDDPDGLR